MESRSLSVLSIVVNDWGSAEWAGVDDDDAMVADTQYILYEDAATA